MKKQPKPLLITFAGVALLAIALANGCSWAGPYPGITVNTDGLGQGQIASYLTGSWMNGDDWIANKVRGLLEVADTTLEPRSGAESIGMHCAPVPSTTCKYDGFVRYRHKGPVPKGDDGNRTHVIYVSIILPDYNDPNGLVVQKTESLSK